MFKAGDKVRCINPFSNNLKVGAVVVVEPGKYHPWVKIRGNHGGIMIWAANRFELVVEEQAVPAPAIIAPVEPQATVLQVGSLVKCVRAYRPAGLRLGKVCTVTKLTDKLIWVAEHVGGFKRDRFELVGAAPKAIVEPPKAPPRPFKVGDMVYVVAKVEQAEGRRCGWSDEDMRPYLNNGKAYRIEEVDASWITLKQGVDYWSYLPECLSHEVNGKYAAPPKPPVPVAKPVLNLGEQLVEKDVNPQGVSSFAYVHSGRPQFSLNPACFAVLRGDYSYTQFVVSINMTKDLREGEHKNNHERWINYMLNDSPWAKCYTTKDVNEAYKGGVVMNCNEPKSQVIGAAITIRELTEVDRRNLLPVFSFMMDHGYTGDVAYITAICINQRDADTFIHSFNSTNHSAIISQAPYKDVLSFFANGFAGKGDKTPMNASDKYGYEIFREIGKEHANRGEGLDDYVRKNCVAVVKGEGWNKNSKIDKAALFAFADKLTQDIKESKK